MWSGWGVVFLLAVSFVDLFLFVLLFVFFCLFALLLFLFAFSFVCLLGEAGFVWPIGVTRFVVSLRGVVYF